MLNLHGKVALVAGATRGAGRGIACAHQEVFLAVGVARELRDGAHCGAHECNVSNLEGT